MTVPNLSLKTDGEIYIAVHPENASSTSIHPVSEFPCYLILSVEQLLGELCEATTPDTHTPDEDIDAIQTQLPRENSHYAFVRRGHQYLLEERQYDSYPIGSEYTAVRAVGYVSSSPILIHATHNAITNELTTVASPDALIDRITNPDSFDTESVKRIAHDPPRPTLADYGIDKHTPDTPAEK
jgi:hypothetical protein